MSDKKFTIEFEMEPLFSNVIVTAYEGGSTYWAYVKDKIPTFPDNPEFDKLAPSERLVRKLIDDPEYKLDVFDVETDERLGSLSQASMCKAFQLAAVMCPHVLSSVLSDNYDANDADILFQYAIMEELVYG